MNRRYERGRDRDRRALRRAEHGRDATRTLAALGIAASLALAACGDDDDDAVAAEDAASNTTTGAMTPGTFAPEYAEYCTLIVELGDAFPTPEQVEAIRAAAPDEISEQIDVVADAFSAAADDPSAAFSDPAVLEALEPIEELEASKCGITPPGDGPPQDPSVTVIDPAATRVDVSGTDYAFHAGFPTTAGRYSFVMSNDGEAAHLMILVKLVEGATLAEAMASEGEEGVEASFESDLAPPGQEAVLTVDLTPGTWVLVCPLPGPDGQDHAELGMVHELTIS